MAADTDATAPTANEENLALTLASSSTVTRINGLNQLNERIKREGSWDL
jgi:sulfur transfer protein SufE